jgi:hypothetical protein
MLLSVSRHRRAVTHGALTSKIVQQIEFNPDPARRIELLRQSPDKNTSLGER